MASPLSRIRPFWLLAIALLVAGTGLGWWYERHRTASEAEAGRDAQLEDTLANAGISAKQRAAMEELVRAYILDHPEILPEAMDRLQQREAQARSRRCAGRWKRRSPARSWAIPPAR
jgi:hypothetical protein